VRREHHRLARELHHRHEVLLRVEGHLEEVRGGCERVGRGKHQVAVGRLLGDVLRGDVAARAGAVLDHHRLRQGRRDTLGEGAHRDVGRAPRRERDQHANRLLRPALRLRGRDQDLRGERADKQPDDRHAGLPAPQP
jgi:hypothetical protein